MIVLPVQVNDGLPLIGLEFPVDALGLGLHLRLKVVVALDVRAAGRANLHKRKHTLVARILFEEAFDGEETLENALGVVDAIDTNTQ